MSELIREELRRYGTGRRTALTIGNFDGVHRGHQHLINFVIRRAHEVGFLAGAITLYPDPSTVLRPQEPSQYLTSLEERLELLTNLGLDFVVPVTFTSEVAELSPRDFVGMLHEELGMRLLIMGPDNAFGRNREATPEAVAEIGDLMGFSVQVVAQPLSQDESWVSSTSIRNALASGDIETVEAQLGRRYSLRGPVVHGDHRGRTIGFPTANIGVTPDRALPAFGVYATWAYLSDQRYASVTNIGRRPTFNGERTSVETFIFDFEGDLYDQTLRIELVRRLRDEVKFDGIEALTAQLHRDAAEARVTLQA